MQKPTQQLETTQLDRFGDLQRILRCPHTGQPLALLDAEQLQARLPEEKRQLVPEGMTGAFVSEQKQLAFPIVRGVVHLLDDAALPISEIETEDVQADDQSAVKESVKKFYDEYGWQRNEAGVYNDTWINSQSGLTAHGAYEMMSHLSFVDRVAAGEFLLDAASGAIAHPEYLSYSWLHRYRVCVDMSQTALLEAAAKMGDRGFCVLADITRLPFCDGVFDGIVSGYTTQHIPDGQQRQAVGELYRTLRPGNHLCIMTGIVPSMWHQAMLQTVRVARKLLKLVKIVRYQPLPDTELTNRPPVAPHKLYFHPQTTGWWSRVARELSPSHRIECLRLFHKKEFEYLFGASRESARSVRRWETFIPRLLARMSIYLLVDLFKPQD